MNQTACAQYYGSVGLMNYIHVMFTQFVEYWELREF